MNRRGFAFMALAALTCGGGTAALAAGAGWDGLTRVSSRRFQNVYLLPGADFRPYAKVMLDPTEVAFRRNWQREFNSSTARSPAARITDDDIEQMVDQGGKAATDIFAQAFEAGGFPVVSAPGPDVLRVRTAVVNLTITSPDRLIAGRSRTFAGQAGTATLVIEARDSVSGALLGRAVDPQIAGDSTILLRRTRVSNRADFQALAQRWARSAVSGLQELKSMSPVSG
jgi:hypothetical protein